MGRVRPECRRDAPLAQIILGLDKSQRYEAARIIADAKENAVVAFTDKIGLDLRPERITSRQYAFLTAVDIFGEVFWWDKESVFFLKWSKRWPTKSTSKRYPTSSWSGECPEKKRFCY